MSEDSRSGLRQRKKARTRDDLVEAALTLFLERGYDATTIDDVVARVELSRRTFFRYFRSKDDVVLAWVDSFCDGVVEQFGSRPAGEDPMTSMRHAFIATMARYDADRAHLLAVERLIATTAAIRAVKRDKMGVLVDQLTAALARRLDLDARRDLAPRVIASVASAVATAVVDTWLASGGKASLTKLLDQGFRSIKVRG